MQRRGIGGLAAGVAIAVAIALIAVVPALAHIERPAYWPDPKPDCTVHPCAGGKVPAVRSLASALKKRKVGMTRVVCQSGSLKKALASISKAHNHGYRLRPTVHKHKLSAKAARQLAAINRALARRCRFHSIQKAVNSSHNGDRVVIMPGVYTEPASRRKPTHDPRCKKYLSDTDFGGGGSVGLSYRYQYHCPNDQNLVEVLGRALGPGAPPPPQQNRNGIPKSDLGPCIRCNLQIEGSGAKPEDVVIDSGKAKAGNHGPSGTGSKKDVALRVDRADGLVLRNLTARHAKEHDVYIMETDGYQIDRVKFFYAGEYGSLMFAADHGLTHNCEGVGNGDSAVYPGGAPQSRDDPISNPPDPRDKSFYPRPRLNQRITHCDLHHNNLAYSGTMGNATHFDHNNLWNNTTGIATDSFFAGGHPGFPQDSSVFEYNKIWSNNFNDYAKGSDVKSSVGVPLGTGIIIAGGNNDLVRGNRMWDNWRRGVMLLAVHDAISCPPSPGPQTCQPKNPSSTSYNSNFTGNVLGRAPNGRVKPNGVDFWWDQFPSNTGDCWHDNKGPDGTNASWTGDPTRFPTQGMSVPGFLPEACGTPGDVGTGNPAKEAVLAYCAEAAIGDPSCEWYQQPARPSGGAAAPPSSSAKVRQWTARHNLWAPPCQLVGDTLSCLRYAYRP